MTQKKGNKALS